MTTGFDLTEAAVSFNADTEVNWNSFPLPIPDNILTFATDTQKFKLGDGVHRYHDLTEIVTLSEISTYHQDALNTLVSLPLMSSNHIITINSGLFTASSASIVDINARIEAIISKDNLQDATIAAVNSQFNSIDNAIGGGDNDKLVVVGNHQMQPGVTVASVTPTSKYVSPISIIGIAAYSDQACTVPIDKLYPNSTYYIKVEASHNTFDTTLLVYELSSNSLYTSVEVLGSGLFRIRVSESPINSTVAFTATVSYNTDSANSVLSVPILGYIEQPIFANSIGVYTDIECTITATQFVADMTYYAKVDATFGDIDISTINFSLAANNLYTTVTNLGLGVFKIAIGEADIDYILTLIASVSHGTYNVNCSIEVPLAMYVPAIQYDEIAVYSDINCSILVTSFVADSTYYAKIKVIAPKTPVSLITFTLTDDSQYTTITHIGDDVFKIAVAEPLVDVFTILTANASYKTTSVGGTKSVPLLQYVPAIIISDIAIFNDADCTVGVTQFTADSTYYAKIDATYGNLNINQVAFELSDANTYTTISHVINNIFKIDVTEPAVAGSTTLTGTASYSTNSSTGTRTVPLLQYIPTMTVSGIGIFSDAGCTVAVTQFSADTSYYAKVNATFGNLTIDQITFALFDTNQYTSITLVNNNVFKIDVAEPLVDITTILTGTASYSTASANDTLSVTLLQYVPAITIGSISIFSDAGCTTTVTQFAADTSYYAKVNATYGNLTIGQVAFGLSDTNTYTTITSLGLNIFKIDVTEPLVTGSTTLTGTASYSTASANNTRIVTLLQYVPTIIVTSIGVFSDAGCTAAVTQFAADTSYYAKVNATYGNLTIGQVAFDLSDISQYTTITHIDNNIFKIDVAEPLVGVSTTLTGTASYSTMLANNTKVVPMLQYIPTMAISSIGIFSDAGCTTTVTQFEADSTYYAKVNATYGNLTIGQVAFDLSDANTYTTITPIGSGIFKIDVTEPDVAYTLVMTGTASYSTASANKVKNVPLLQYIPTMAVTSIGVFSDVGCTVGVTQFEADSTYYAKINATYGNLSIGQISFYLSDANGYTTISPVSNNIFKIVVTEPLIAGSTTLTGTASYSTASANNTKVVPLLQYIPTMAVTSIGVFSDAICSAPTSSFVADTSYYAKVNATFGNLTIGQVTFGLSDNSNYTTITPIGSGVFKIDVTEPLTDGSTTFTGTVSYSTASANATKDISLLQYVPTISLTSIGVYSDADCTVNATSFAADTSYYAKVNATYGNLNINQVTFDLSDANNYTTISHLGTNIFKIDVTEPPASDSITLTGTASYSTASSTGTANVTLSQYVPVISITGFDVFSDAGCTVSVSSLAADTSYYAKLVTSHGNLTVSQLTHGLTSNSGYATITPVGLGVFKVDIAEPSVAGSVTFTGTVSYSTASANSTVNKTLLQYVPTIVVSGIDIFSDAGCTVAVTQFAADTSYYAKVNATFGNLTIDKIGFGLSDASTYTTISPVSGSIFKIDVTEPLVAGSTTLTGTASYSTASANNTKVVPLLQYIPTMAVSSIDIFSDAGCTTTVTQFAADSTYYAKVNATYGNLTLGQVTFNLSDNSSYTTISLVSNNVFKIDVTEPLVAGSTTLTGTASYSTASANNTKVVPLLQYIPTMAVSGVTVYSDAGCTIGVSSFAADTTYYAKIAATYGNLTIGQVTFSMSSDSTYVTPTAVGNGVFSLAVTEPSTAGTVILTGTASYSTASANNTKSVTLPQYIPTLTIASITPYYDAAYTKVASVFLSSTSYYVKVVGTFGNLLLSNMTFGLTTTDTHCTVVDRQSADGKGCFRIDVGIEVSNTTLPLNATMSYSTATVNNSINIIVNKPFNNNVFVSIFNGSVDDYFQDVAVDTLNNIICVGYTTSEGAGLNDALIVKYDSNFNVLYKKVYGGTGDEYFYSVTTDSSNNIVAVGSTTSEGANGDALIVKFDPTLTILAKSHIGTTSTLYSTNYTAGTTLSNLPVSTDITMLGKGGPRNTFNPSTNYTAGTTLSGLPLNTDVTMVGKGGARNTYSPSTNYTSSTTLNGLPLNTSINMVGRGGPRYVASSGTNYVFPANNDGNFVAVPDYAGGYAYPRWIPQLWSLGAVGVTCDTVDSEGTQYNPVTCYFTNLYVSGSRVYGILLFSNTYTYGTCSWALTAQGYTNYAAGPAATETINGTTYSFPGQDADGTYNTTTYNISTGGNASSTLTIPSGGNINVAYTYYTAGAAATETINGATWTFPGQSADGTYNATTITKNTVANASSTLTIPSGGNINVSYTYYTAGTAASETINGTTYNFPGQSADGTWNANSITQNTGSNVNSTLTIPTGGNIQVSYNVVADKIDIFYCVTTDHAGNFIAAGGTTTEGSGLQDALVIKFDTNLGVLYKKVYGGAYNEQFNGVAVDSSNNIICAGQTNSEAAASGSPTYNDALVVKFDSSLNLVARKIYGGATTDTFLAVAVDTLNNIICVGYTTSEGANANGDALIVKFDNSLAILYRKIYGGTGIELFLRVKTDSSNNIICAGYTNSEGLGGNEALLCKFDSTLTSVSRKRYGGAAHDYFKGVVCDSANNIICVGNSLTAGTQNGLLIKSLAALPTGTLTGSLITNMTLADSTLTLANSALTLGADTLALANSALIVTTSVLTLNTSTSPSLFDILY